MTNYEKNFKIEETIQQRRAKIQAVAFLNRGKSANIPEQHLRINEKTFLSLLDNNSHEDKNEFTHDLYNTEIMLNTPLILIDGGNEEIRKRAGFALLFRIILFDKWGMYKDCRSLVHQLQNINSFVDISGEEVSRNSLASELKRYDCLFIGEFGRELFKPNWDTGTFFDEILSSRIDNVLPTIISFSDPINSFDKNKSTQAAMGKLNIDCGRYLASFCIEEYSKDKVIRVRVGNK
jgi:hypothetical protein